MAFIDIRGRKKIYDVTASYYYRTEVEEEVRVQVDELMRQELKNLKLVSFYKATFHFNYFQSFVCTMICI